MKLRGGGYEWQLQLPPQPTLPAARVDDDPGAMMARAGDATFLDDRRSRSLRLPDIGSELAGTLEQYAVKGVALHLEAAPGPPLVGPERRHGATLTPVHRLRFVTDHGRRGDRPGDAESLENGLDTGMKGFPRAMPRKGGALDETNA